MKSLTATLALATALGLAGPVFADQPFMGFPSQVHAGTNTFSFSLADGQGSFCIPQNTQGAVNQANVVTQALVAHRSIEFSVYGTAYCKPSHDGPAMTLPAAVNISLSIE